MIKITLSKIALIIVMVPILHFIGFTYAIYHPSFFQGNFRNQTEAEAEGSGYVSYVTQILQTGELGQVGGADLIDLLARPFVNSIILIIFALTLAVVGGMLIGFLSISSRTNRIRPMAFMITSAGASIPGFLLGGVVIAIVVYQTLYAGLSQTWLPMNGCGEANPLPFSSCGIDRHLILPLVVLAVRPMLHIAKVTAGMLEDELQKNYIRTARSKGARWLRVFGWHALRNILAPIIVLASQSLRFIVGGLLIAEIMFLWPGIGRFFVYAVVANQNLRGQYRFFANPELIAALAVLIGLIILTADLIASLASHAADPRLRSKS